jgi:ZIP family zinc transporter
MHDALVAAGWSVLAASSLLVGMVLALVWKAPKRVIGVVMAFGAGAMFSAISFQLADEAIAKGSETLLALGMLAGATIYVAGSRLLRSKTNSDEPGAAEDSRSIVLGATLDGIPESLAIGATVQAAHGSSGAMSLGLLVAVALSNLPESMGATAGMRAAKHATWKIVSTWTGLVVVSGIAAAIGYVVLARVDESVGGALDAFTAGAVLAMLTDTMIPDAYTGVGRAAGFATVVGFALAFLIS